MKRDLDLSRAILKFIEEHSPAEGGLDQPLAIDGYDRQTVLAHAELLVEDGKVDGKVLRASFSIVDVMVTKLTNSGHDALKAIQDDTVWSKVKKTAAEKGISLSLDLAVQLGRYLLHQRLGLPSDYDHG